MSKSMLITVGIGKNREDVAHGISFSIRQNNPEYIIFITTDKSKQETLPFVLKNSCMSSKKYEIQVLSNENDIELIRKECGEYIESLIAFGYIPENIVVDYTTGTKAMSAGLILSSIEKKVGTITYVYGERNSEGRVVSGSEKLITLQPNEVYANSIYKSAIDFFNKTQFDSCIELLQKAQGLIGNPQTKEKFYTLEQLAQAYSYWDRFDLQKAFNILKDFSSKNIYLQQWKIKSKVEQNKQILHKEKDNQFCLERIVDLLENANRRLELEGKYDDAVARLYRLLEFVAQYKMVELALYKKHNNGLPDTEDIDIDKLPNTLRSKYESLRSNDGKIRLGLVNTYDLLAEMKTPLGLTFMEQFNNGTFKKLLGLRNKSLLAHGFSPIGQTASKEMFSEVAEFIKKSLPDTENFFQTVKFPRISDD